MLEVWVGGVSGGAVRFKVGDSTGVVKTAYDISAYSICTYVDSGSVHDHYSVTITNQTEHSFTIELSPPAKTDMAVGWMLIDNYGPAADQQVEGRVEQSSPRPTPKLCPCGESLDPETDISPRTGQLTCWKCGLTWLTPYK